MNLKQLLIGTRAKIAQGHTKKTLARNAAGDAVPSNNPDAVCFCIYGAMFATMPYNINMELINKCIWRIHEAAKIEGSLPVWNDREETTQETVLELLDELIAKEA